MKHENATRMLISFFNMKIGTRYRVTNRGEEFETIIADDESNISDIRQAINEWAEKKNDDLSQFVNWYKYERNTAQKEAPVQQMNMGDANQGLAFLTNVVTQMVAQTKTEEIESKVVAGLKDKIDQYIFDTYGTIEKKVTLVSEYGKHEVPGVQHKTSTKPI